MENENVIDLNEGTTLPNETQEEKDKKQALVDLAESKATRRKFIQQAVKESLESLESEYGLKMVLVAHDSYEDQFAVWKSNNVSTLEFEGLKKAFSPF
tara:strand:+ start:198 stop:491 length:294 start_codon:yes stop_codon:yes gene_type:complete